MRTGRKKVITLWVASLACTAAAADRAIDTGKSSMTVRVYKAGVLSAFGHDHEIAAPIASGAVDTAAHRVELRVNARAMQVRDPGSSEKDRAQVQSNMVGAEVLDVEHHPEIVFRSTGAEPAGAGAWKINGSLALHGQTRPVTVEVKEAGGHYVGNARLKLTDFGIQPIRIAGGAIKVKDEIRIEFDIQLAR